MAPSENECHLIRADFGGQLELDDGDAAVLLVDGRLAFCVANLLKCLSVGARSGQTSPDAAVAACDTRIVEMLSDVL